MYTRASLPDKVVADAEWQSNQMSRNAIGTHQLWHGYGRALVGSCDASLLSSTSIVLPDPDRTARISWQEPTSSAPESLIGGHTSRNVLWLDRFWGLKRARRNPANVTQHLQQDESDASSVMG